MGGNDPQPGLDNNPGIDAKIFADSHPYIANAYEGALEAVEKVVEQMENKRTKSVFPEIQSKIEKVENEIRNNKSFETAVAFSEEGNIIIDKRGKAFSVGFSKEELLKMKDTVMTHNHPRGWKYADGSLGRIGSSFSPEDIILAIKGDLAEIRAVTPLYTFSMKRPEKGWGATPDE